MYIDDFNHTIDHWLQILESYEFSDLIKTTQPGHWSLGQVYMHLIEDTHYYITQIGCCTGNNQFADEPMKEAGKEMLRNNAFPDIRIKGDPESAAAIPQPAGKAILQKELTLLKEKMNTAWQSFLLDPGRGKTQHPGLGYFNAEEWLRFAEMHLRHHLKQKARIEAS